MFLTEEKLKQMDAVDAALGEALKLAADMYEDSERPWDESFNYMLGKLITTLHSYGVKEKSLRRSLDKILENVYEEKTKQ